MASRGPTPEASKLGVEVRRIRALHHATRTAVRIRELQAVGLNLGQIAAALTAEDYSTLYDGRWRASSVQRVLEIAGPGTTKPNAPAPVDWTAERPPARGRIV